MAKKNHQNEAPPDVAAEQTTDAGTPDTASEPGPAGSETGAAPEAPAEQPSGDSSKQRRTRRNAAQMFLDEIKDRKDEIAATEAMLATMKAELQAMVDQISGAIA